MKLEAYVKKNADDGLLTWARESEAAHRFGVSLRDVEDAALRAGILPLRYLRNRNTIGIGQQLRLLRSRVAVIGCGGLGGHVIEALARLGVGSITAVDPDVFEESNLNRQVFSSINVLGRNKAEVAAERVAEINPAVACVPVASAWTKSGGNALIQGHDVVVDALDRISVRLELALSCGGMGIPLVHGGIGGWYGQVTTQMPGEDSLQKIYGVGKSDRGIEAELGNPPFVPAVVAGIEAAEVCKLLLHEGAVLRGRLLLIDLLDMIIQEISL